MGRVHLHETAAAMRAHHPVVVENAARRAASVQLRIADSITTFAGSMPFVYLHAVLFAGWMLFVESAPWPKLTLIVSLEGDLPVDVRHDRPEPPSRVPACQGRP